MKLSILIPHLTERKVIFEPLHQELLRQTEGQEVEILINEDQGQKTIGLKRNELLEQAKGEYVCYVDDDDKLSGTYVFNILEAIKAKPDCVSLKGIYTVKGQNPRTFIHSIQYNTYFESNNTFFRPPNHLNCIKAEIAKRFTFPLKNFSEDTDWAMQICRAGVLKTEAKVDNVLYYYNYTK